MGSAAGAASAIPRPSHERAAAVVDIGSNTIRLAVFDRLENTLAPLHNERVFCALGRGLAAGGPGAASRLDPAAAADALRAVTRFARLARTLGVRDVDLIATAAVREASDGKRLVRDIEKACGERVRVLDGREEARLAALGVAAGTPKATGIVGDLGGGSLELVEIDHGRTGRHATLPLGTLRMAGAFETDPKGAAARLREALAGVEWLAGKPRAHFFYPVGGTWRALARLHIERSGHPLHVIHAYTLRAGVAAKFAGEVRGLRPAALEAAPGINRRRARHLPYGALLLEEVLRATRARRVRFCSTGVREGVVHERAPERERPEDALLAAAEALGHREARFPEFAETLFEWLSPLAGKRRWRRLARAACHLADVAWREHPDYRAEQGLLRVVRHNYLAAEHGERAFLGLAVFARYGGGGGGRGGNGNGADTAKRLWPLVSEGGRRRAEAVGCAMRLAYRLSAGSAGLLAGTRLKYRPERLVLELGGGAVLPVGEAVEQDFEALARALGAARREIRSGGD